MVSPEVPVLFSKACEMLIMELTVRSWTHTAMNRRKVVHKNDIATAISRTDIFDFLVEIVQRDELKEAEGLGMPRARMPVEKPADPVSYGGLYSLPQPEDPPARPPNVALIVGRSAEHQGPGMPRAAMPVRLTRADPRSYGGLYYLPPPRKPPAIPPNVAVMVGRPAD
ncbi:hypothetical protein O6H91_13G074100 [Diphasiastrum complanatum]|nr:hypothetical protein O6H91_13G074100 [Diphasiastrum complanatum]